MKVMKNENGISIVHEATKVGIYEHYTVVDLVEPQWDLMSPAGKEAVFRLAVEQRKTQAKMPRRSWKDPYYEMVG